MKNTTPARYYTKEDAAKMTLEEAQEALGKCVYEAAHLFEKLEQAGQVHGNGNGHHARQNLAAAAEEDLAERWMTPDLRNTPSKS